MSSTVVIKQLKRETTLSSIQFPSKSEHKKLVVILKTNPGKSPLFGTGQETGTFVLSVVRVSAGTGYDLRISEKPRFINTDESTMISLVKEHAKEFLIGKCNDRGKEYLAWRNTLESMSGFLPSQDVHSGYKAELRECITNRIHALSYSAENFLCYPTFELANDFHITFKIRHDHNIQVPGVSTKNVTSEFYINMEWNSKAGFICVDDSADFQGFLEGVLKNPSGLFHWSIL